MDNKRLYANDLIVKIDPAPPRIERGRGITDLATTTILLRAANIIKFFRTPAPGGSRYFDGCTGQAGGRPPTGHRIHLFKYMKGMSIMPVSHLMATWPMIKGAKGITPAKANGTKIKLSSASAGRELKTFLAQRCRPPVSCLNQENIMASAFSDTKKAAQLARVILGTRPKILSQLPCRSQRSAAGILVPIQRNRIMATCEMNPSVIIRCVSTRPNLSLTTSVRRKVTENTKMPPGPTKVLKPRSNTTTLAARIWATRMKVTYRTDKRSDRPYLRAYQLPSRLKLVIPIIQSIKIGNRGIG